MKNINFWIGMFALFETLNSSLFQETLKVHFTGVSLSSHQEDHLLLIQ